MPSRNQKDICDQLEGSLHYRLEDISSLPDSKKTLVDQLGRHAVLDVVEVDLEAGFPFTVQTIAEFKKLRKLRINGIDPIVNGYDPIFGFLDLEELVFERSSLDDLSGFAALKRLRKFGCYDLTRYERGAEVFGALPNLKTLQLGESSITEKELIGISKSGSIVELTFAVAEDGLDLAPISEMKQLKYLDIRRSNKSDINLAPLLRLPNLKRFTIRPQIENDSDILRKMEEQGTTIDA